MLPTILTASPVLIPIKIDITHAGARYVDCFCWDINNSTFDQFAAITVSDLGLPLMFQIKLG